MGAKQCCMGPYSMWLIKVTEKVLCPPITLIGVNTLLPVDYAGSLLAGGAVLQVLSSCWVASATAVTTTKNIIKIRYLKLKLSPENEVFSPSASASDILQQQLLALPGTMMSDIGPLLAVGYSET